MAEQLKKAAKSVFVIYYRPLDIGRSGTSVYVGATASILGRSIYSSLNYIGDTSPSAPKPTESGKVNWGKGDVLLFKSYVCITPAVGVEQPDNGDFDITTSSYYPTTQWTKLSNSEIEIEDKNKFSNTVLLDSFVCKVTGNYIGGGAGAVIDIMLPDNTITLNHYTVDVKSKGITDQEKMKIGLLQVTLEAEYIGTEQADGSLVYLA